MRQHLWVVIAFGVAVLAACGKPAVKSSAPGATSQTGTQGDATRQVPESPGQLGGPVPVDSASAPVPPAAAAAAAATLSPDKLPAALQAIGAKPAPRGQVINDCGDAVTPTIKAADLGGDIGRAWLVVIGGGPSMAACYGDTGMAIFLLKPEAHGFKMIFSGQGNLAVLPTDHKGVKDIAIAGPGFDFPVYAWNGSAYEHSSSIKDSELPPTLN